jgi:hypothetical protein
MSIIDPKRRQQLIDKYGIDRPPNPDHPIVAAMLDAEQIAPRMFNWPAGTDLRQLWDPAQCPEMYAVATKAHRELHLAVNSGEIEVTAGDGQTVDPNTDDAAVLVNFVGSPEVIAVRGDTDGDLFAAVYRATWHGAVRRVSAEHCQVQIMPQCGGTDGQRAVEFWPCLRGRYLLMFMVCPACRDRAIEIAEDGQTLAVLAAHERLADMPDPAWARTAPRWMRWRAAAR